MKKLIAIPKGYIDLIWGMGVLLGVFLITHYNYLLFYTLAEVFTVMVAWGIFIIAWNGRQFIRDRYLLFISIAYLFAGGIDLIHALAYKNMGVFQNGGANLSTQLWIVARYIQSISLLVAPFTINKKINPYLIFLVYAGVVSLLLCSIFFWDNFPNCYIEGVGLTTFKKNSEYIICLILLGAITITLRKKENFNPHVLKTLIGSILITIISELIFTLYYNIYGFANTLGHLLKILAFYLIYKELIGTALLKPYLILFRTLKQNEEMLKSDLIEHQQIEELLRQAYDELTIKIEEQSAALFTSSAALKQTSQTLQAVIQASPVAIIAIDLDSKVKLWNPAAEKIFGWNESEVLGQFLPIILSHKKAEFQSFYKKVLQGESHIELEVCRQRRDGSLIDISISNALLFDETGHPNGIMAIIVDITEKKQIEVALRDSETRYRLLFENNPHPMWVLDPETLAFLTVNKAAIKQYGYSRDEFLSMTLRDIRLPEDIPALIEYFYQRKLDSQSEYKQVGVWKHCKRDGTILDVEITSHSILFDGKKAILVLANDVTERRRAEAEIKRLNADLERRALASETKYQQIVELVDEGIWVIDTEGTIIYVNQAMVKMLGYTESEMVGCQIFKFINQEEEPIFRHNLEIRKQGVAAKYELRFKTKNGTSIWTYISASPVINENGTMLWSCALVYNITERKKAEQALRESEERFRLLVEYVKEYAIFMLDPQGYIVSWNLGAERIKGYTATEIIGKHMSSFYLAEEIQQGKPQREIDIAAQEGRFEAENWRIRKDGSSFWADVVITALRDEEGMLRGFSQVIRDITQRKLAEEQLRQSSERISLANAELARATRLKDEFLASMSHELRTPLNAILGLSEALQEKVYGPLTEKQLKTLITIEQSGKHLLDVINDILDLSKIESGKLELQITPTCAAELCDSSLTFVKQAAHHKNIKLSCEIAEGLRDIEVDERRMRQVLINLLSNAVKFTPEGGEVSIKVEVEPANEIVEFSVIDNGIGIASEDIHKLFKPFVQLDSSLSRSYSGTGLGLALVRRIVELHGGSVKLESQVGRGSRFSVSIPWKEQNLPIESLPTTGIFCNISPPNLYHALIVEDSHPAAHQIARYLWELGAVPIIHPQGEGTVEQVVKLKPDVIILDLLLPHLSGWDVLAQLKADSRTQNIPVLIISVVDERSRALTMGAGEYLVKPISRQQFYASLNRILPNVDSFRPETGLFATYDKLAPPLILLAEDNEANISTVLDYLEVQGYRVILARNGIEAVQMAKTQKPDLILMDIQMPEMDGLEATRQIRFDGDTATIPIIAITSLAMPGDREKCLVAGVNEYLTKPVSLKNLMGAIAQYLKHY